MPPTSPPRAHAARAAIFVLVLFISSQLSLALSRQLFIVCNEPRNQVCFSWIIKTKEIFEKLKSDPVVKSYCGLSDLKFLRHEKYIKVKLLENGETRKVFCKDMITINEEHFYPTDVLPMIKSYQRVRRQAGLSLRGRYRGQTQSQYLAIDRGSGNDDGKAEALSTADSSKASVSGSSGMGQAQSQTMYDPSCQDCFGGSSFDAESLRRGPTGPPSQAGIPSGGSGHQEGAIPGGSGYIPQQGGPIGSLYGRQPGGVPGGSPYEHEQGGGPGGNSYGLQPSGGPGGPGGPPYVPQQGRAPGGSTYGPQQVGIPGELPYGPQQGGVPGSSTYGPQQSGASGVPPYGPQQGGVPGGITFRPQQGGAAGGNTYGPQQQGGLPSVTTYGPQQGTIPGVGTYGSQQGGMPGGSAHGSPQGGATGIGPYESQGSIPGGSSYGPQQSGTPGGSTYRPQQGGVPGGSAYGPQQGAVPGVGTYGPQQGGMPSVSTHGPQQGGASSEGTYGSQQGGRPGGGMNGPQQGVGPYGSQPGGTVVGSTYGPQSSAVPGGSTYGTQPGNAPGGGTYGPQQSGLPGGGTYGTQQGSGSDGINYRPQQGGVPVGGSYGPQQISGTGGGPYSPTGGSTYGPQQIGTPGGSNYRPQQGGVPGGSTYGPQQGAVPGVPGGSTYGPQPDGAQGGIPYGPQQGQGGGPYGTQQSSAPSGRPYATQQGGAPGSGPYGSQLGTGQSGSSYGTQPSGVAGGNSDVGAYVPHQGGGNMSPGNLMPGPGGGLSDRPTGTWPPPGSFQGSDGSLYYCCVISPNGNQPYLGTSSGGFRVPIPGQSNPSGIVYGQSPAGSPTTGSNLQSPGSFYGPGTNAGLGPLAPGQQWPSGGSNIQRPGSLVGVTGGGAGAISNGQYGINGPGANSGQFGIGSDGSNSQIPGGQYIVNPSGGTSGPNLSLGPGTILGQTPTEQYGSRPSGVPIAGQQVGSGVGPNTQLPGGQYGFGTGTLPSDQYGLGNNGQNNQIPGGQFINGPSSGSSTPGGGAFVQTPSGGTTMQMPGGDSTMQIPGGGSSIISPGGGPTMLLPGGGSSIISPGGGPTMLLPGGGTSMQLPGSGSSSHIPAGDSMQIPPGQVNIGSGMGPNAPGVGGQYGIGLKYPSASGQYGAGTNLPTGGGPYIESPGNKNGAGANGIISSLDTQNGNGPGGHFDMGAGIRPGLQIPGQYGTGTIPSGTGSVSTQYVPGGTANSNLPTSSGQYGHGSTGNTNEQGGAPGYGQQGGPGFSPGSSSGTPQNVLDPNSIAATLDDSDSDAEATVSQNANGTTASAISSGGSTKGRAQTNVQGTYSGTGSFSAQANIVDENKGAQSQVEGGKKGAKSSAQGSGRNNLSQASVQLGSETGSLLTNAESSGAMHASNSKVQGSVKGGMADASARGPGSTSSQAQIGFTPYKDGDENHELLRTPFSGSGTASAKSSGQSGQSHSNLQGTFKYGVSYNGAAQAGASLDKDAVFPNKLPFNSIDVFDENDKNINVNTEIPSDGTPLPDISVTERTDETMSNSESRYSGHPHSSHHRSESQLPPSPSPAGSRRSFQSSYGTPNNGVDYEYRPGKDNPADDYYPDGFSTDGAETGDVEQSEYGNYDEYTRDSDTTHQSLHESNQKGLEVKQSTGGNTQHIVLGSLNGQDAEITQRNSERPDENRIYQPGERVPGTGGYTIPIGFTGSVKSIASKDKTYVRGYPSQAQTVSLSPGSGKVKYNHPASNGRNVNPKDLRSLHSYNNDDSNRYVSLSKSVTRDLDSDNNIRKQYSHTYYTKSSSCGYFTFTCTMVSSSEGRRKVCKPKIPTNPDGTPIKC